MKQRSEKNGHQKVQLENTKIALLPVPGISNKRGFDPLILNDTIAAFKAQILHNYGIVLSTSIDFDEFVRVRTEARGSPPQPAFHPDVSREALNDSAFWLHGQKNDKTVLLIAYRLLHVDRNFRDWVINWQVWEHTLLGEDVSIHRPQDDRPLSSQISDLRGPVCYAGEMWLGRSERSKGLSYIVDDLNHIGNLLVWQLWKPKAVFGLSTADGARTGTANRMQFDSVETSFLQWRRRPACVNHDEEMLMFTPEPRLRSRVLDAQKRLFGGSI